MDKVIRGIPDPVMHVLNTLAPRKAMEKTPQGQERPNSNAIIVHVLSIRALGTPYWYQVAELEDIALKIAQHRRREHELKSVSAIVTKLLEERIELERTDRQNEDDLNSRIASYIYYLTLQFLYDHDIEAYLNGLQSIAEQYECAPELLLLLCLAKFRERSMQESSDKVNEIMAMRQTKSDFLHVYKSQ